MSGVETAYRSLKKQGKMDKDISFVAFGGDGGTYDIGLQSLSGAAERGHKFLYVCYNNQAYMNTGVQRSSATPKAASTTTSPVGKEIPGKVQFQKDLTEIMVAHEIPYVATAVPGRWNDLAAKVEKATKTDGLSFMNILSPCRLGWPHDPVLTLEITKIAADTCVWPLYEVVNGKYKLTYKPKEKKPVTEWLKLQGRFANILKPGNESILKSIQDEVDRKWEILLKKCQA
jgi:pyruvate ferredoxin oxidoreductase beta subunit